MVGTQASYVVDGDLVNKGADLGLASAITPEEDKQEMARLRSQHSLYAEYAPLWDFYLAAYEGGTDFVNAENLFRYPREHADDWADRLKRAHYHNYCERLVDFFSDFIFAETIQRTPAPDDKTFFDGFINDVNKKGDSITDFMKSVGDDMQIFGMSFILVDAPVKPTDVIVTKADEARLGIKPYWVLIRPTEILDWVVDDFDAFIYVKRMQTMVVLVEGVQRCLERYTEWSPAEIKVTDIDVTEKKKPKLVRHEPIANALGEVPLEVIRYKRSKRHRFMGNSFLRDLAYNNREVLNLTSIHQEFLYKQCFNVLAIQRDGSQELQDQQDGEWGTSNAIYYPKDGTAPSYIRPDSAPAEHIMKARQDCVNEMYKRAAQDMVNELFNGGKSSGFSKSMSFSATVPHIASRAETLEKAEQRLFTRTFKYLKKTWAGKIKYKDRYEITNITDALTQLTTLFKDLQMPSETFVKQELKRFVHEFDGKIPLEDMQKIEAEIDAMDFQAFSDTMKLAFVGKGAMSPEAEPVFSEGGTKAPKASTPTRAQSSTAELSAESSKQSLKK